MAYDEEKEDNVDSLSMYTDETKKELYLYSLRKMAEHNMESNRNLITNLYNFRTFLYKSSEIMLENPQKKFAMIVLDIANFKTVNEFCGRDAGDRLLIAIADGLRKYECEYTVVSQFRADNFGMLVPFEEEQELVDVTVQLSKEIDQVKLSCKVLPAFGICVATDPSMPSTLMKDYSTMAMKTIKGKFYANHAFFDEKMRRDMLLEKQIENNIVEAMETEQFRIYIQPKINMVTKKIIGGEALIRWMHPIRGIVLPGDFIPVLEKNGFIINVDIYVWEKVFKMLGKRILEKKPIVPISINISRLHAYQEGFKDCLCKLSEKYQVPPAYVTLELTESGFLENPDLMFGEIKQLKEAGFSIAMDDFGTGYSTMIMLKNQPVNEIKIDKGFIDEIENERSKVVIKHTIAMLKELGVNITVEGVETKEQQDFLLRCGCTEAQGYLYYKPMPAEEFERLLDI
ncbi:MAG: EAL domain-containing protein [Clostridiales bacterium]|nr:EAL domain-containing protein [Clostridiales bacterium]